MKKEIEKTIKYLKARNFTPHYTDNAEAASRLILDLIPKKKVVGIGDSSSVRQTGVIKNLLKRGTKVINPFDPGKKIDDYKDYSKFVFRSSIEASLCDVFMTGTNALTQDGRLINIDGVGNRVTGMIWGHPKVILVIGKNKIVKNLDEALHRVKNVTAPEHVSRRGSSKSPCTIKGECEDCMGRDRVCNVTTIMEGAPLFSEINVVIVNEDLGLGWDRTWSKDRIEKISERHNSLMWSMPEEAIHALTRDELWESVKDLLHS